MNSFTTAAAVVAMLGSAIVGGVFFAFSSFVMKAMARVPDAEGVAAMQSINVVVLNPSFLGAFMGTAAVSVAIAVIAWDGWGNPASIFLLAGASSYLLGTFLVTVIGNVPMNEQLAVVAASDPDLGDVWRHYLKRWTALNTVRTVAAVIAALLYSVGVLSFGGV